MFTEFKQNSFFFFDPITNNPCNENNYWTPFDNTTTCYRWISITYPASNLSTIKLMLDHNIATSSFSDYKNILQSSNLESLNEIDYNDKSCIETLLSCLKIAEFLSYKTSKDYSYYKLSFDYINLLQNKLDNKINSNTNRKDESDLQYIKKEKIINSKIYRENS